MHLAAHTVPYVLAALGVLLLFGISILVHEAGHFLAARWMGMRADAFAIGFGPAIWKRRVGGTEYRVNAIPFGGYVALPQLDPSAMDKVQGGASGEPLPPAAWWRRVVVAVAGPAGNVALAFALALVVAALPYRPVIPGFEHVADATIGWVVPDSPADRAGLRVGDRVLAVGGTPVQTADEFITECHLLSGEGDARLSVSNLLDGAAREVAVPQRRTPRGFYAPDGIAMAGVRSVAEVVPGSAAEKAGIAPGDLLHDLDGVPVFGFDDFTNRVAAAGAAGRPMLLGVLRSGARVEATLSPAFDEEAGRWLLGVATDFAEAGAKQWMKHRNPWRQVRGDAGSILRVLRGLFLPRHKGEAGKVAGALGGPVSIVAGIWSWLLVSIPVTIGFIRYLNVNLAILNLLPIPVLDGGHVLLALWEGATGRKPSRRLVEFVMNVFVVLLLALFALLTFRDSWSLFLRRLFVKG